MSKKEDDELKVTTITIPPDVWEDGVKASKEALGKENFSGYITTLVIADSKNRGIRK